MRLGEVIFESDFGYKVKAVTMEDKATTRISIDIYIESPEGEMSDLITIQKKDVYTKKNWASVFWGLEADLSRNDIDTIKEKIADIIKRNPSTYFQSRETLKDMYKIFSAYIRENKDCSYEKEGEILTGIFIRNDYGYIDSQMLDVFVREYKHIGYKRIDIIKRLKIMGVLEGAGGRNDVLVSVNGKKRRYYKILLTDEFEADEECEVYNPPLEKTSEKETEAVETK